MPVLWGEAAVALVCWDGAIQSQLAGWKENNPHMKMHRSLPHLHPPNNSVETTQPWDDHNKPEHWSQHEVSISQASIHCEANPGFVVNTGGWLMSGPEELCTWFSVLAWVSSVSVSVPLSFSRSLFYLSSYYMTFKGPFLPKAPCSSVSAHTFNMVWLKMKSTLDPGSATHWDAELFSL